MLCTTQCCQCTAVPKALQYTVHCSTQCTRFMFLNKSTDISGFPFQTRDDMTKILFIQGRQEPGQGSVRDLPVSLRHPHHPLGQRPYPPRGDGGYQVSVLVFMCVSVCLCVCVCVCVCVSNEVLICRIDLVNCHHIVIILNGVSDNSFFLLYSLPIQNYIYIFIMKKVEHFKAAFWCLQCKHSVQPGQVLCLPEFRNAHQGPGKLK